jgi:hypothetical protein
MNGRTCECAGVQKRGGVERYIRFDALYSAEVNMTDVLCRVPLAAQALSARQRTHRLAEPTALTRRPVPRTSTV